MLVLLSAAVLHSEFPLPARSSRLLPVLVASPRKEANLSPSIVARCLFSMFCTMFVYTISCDMMAFCIFRFSDYRVRMLQYSVSISLCNYGIMLTC